jgi:hypothetical protein
MILFSTIRIIYKFLHSIMRYISKLMVLIFIILNSIKMAISELNVLGTHTVLKKLFPIITGVMQKKKMSQTLALIHSKAGP